MTLHEIVNDPYMKDLGRRVCVAIDRFVYENEYDNDESNDMRIPDCAFIENREELNNYDLYKNGNIIVFTVRKFLHVIDWYAKNANIKPEEIILENIYNSLISVDVLDQYMSIEFETKYRNANTSFIHIDMTKVKQAIKKYASEDKMPIINYNRNDLSDVTIANLTPKAATNLIKYLVHSYEAVIYVDDLSIECLDGNPTKTLFRYYDSDMQDKVEYYYDKVDDKRKLQRMKDLGELMADVDDVAIMIDRYNYCDHVDMHEIVLPDNVLYVYTFSQN